MVSRRHILALPLFVSFLGWGASASAQTFTVITPPMPGVGTPAVLRSLDCNADGIPEGVMTSGAILRRSGAGTAWETREVFGGLNPVVRDVGQDGSLEVLMTSDGVFDWQFNVLDSNCDFDPTQFVGGLVSSGSALMGVLGDFNGAGGPDFIVGDPADGSMTLFSGNGGMSFTEQTYNTALVEFTTLLAADGNLDGSDNLVAITAGKLTRYSVDPTGGLTGEAEVTDYPPALNNRAFVADVHGVREALFVPLVSTTTPVIRCLDVAGFSPTCATGDFTEAVTGQTTLDITVGDFDNDGTMDIAVLGRDVMGDEYVQIHRQSAARTYSNMLNIPVPNWIRIAAADWDGDGDIDIIGANGTGLEVARNGAPTCGPEICDGLDNDCNGIVDDMASGCAMTQTCHWGTCFEDCSVPGDCPGELCYVDDDRCDDPADPCTNITCQGTEACFGGACFETCTSDAECDPVDETCFNSMRCVKNDDACLEVQCPYGEVCYRGGCFTSCMDDGDCGMPEYCYANRCTDDPCQDVDCPIGNTCYGGSCFVSCGADIECDPTEVCFDADHCAVDACDGVQCPSSQTCYGGSCFDSCFDNPECMPDSCYDFHCASDACDNVQCGTEQTCYQGTCFDNCMNDMDCDPSNVCFSNRCVDPADEYCDGVVCKTGEDCYRGTCFPTCMDQMDCDPMSTCYQNTCHPNDCSPQGCEPSEVCYQGACFVACMDNGDCTPPEACFSGRCAENACAAFDQADLDAYDTGHVFHTYGKKLVATQSGTPWYWPRPVTDGTGTIDIDAFAAINGAGVSMAPVHYPKRARVIIYLDPTDDRYYIWLTHGAGGSQGPAQAVYSIRGEGVNDDVKLVDNNGEEAFFKGGGDPWHIQSFITTGANETGGIVLGPFRADRDWTIEIFPSFSGDIEGWELYDGERFIGYPVSSTQPLRIFTDDFGGGDVITPVAGTPCNTGADGICSVGTALECVNWDMVCYETVAPWSVEVCDGLDNDCDGDVDEDVTYPMVFGKVDGLTGWNNVPTLNDNKTVYDHLDYTAHGGDDRDGSVNPLKADGTPLQDAPMRSSFYAYRNFDTGQISIPMVHGQRLTGVPAAGLSDEDVKLEIELRNGTQMERLFVSYYDDRAPDPDGDDEILRNWDSDDRDFRMEWRVNSTGGPDTWESDAVALNTLWGADDSLVEFTIEWRDYYDDDDASNPFAWRVYRPGIGIDSISSHRRVRLRVDGKQGDDAYCFSSPATFAGCDYGKLQCDPGGITSCTPASDAVCLGCPDIDGDGFPGFDPAICPMGNDCDDGNPNVNPGAPEMCNGLDDDCDGEIDIKTSGCPGGAALCGPDECGFAVSCQCPGGPEIPGDPPPSPACTCGESLTE